MPTPDLHRTTVFFMSFTNTKCFQQVLLAWLAATMFSQSVSATVPPDLLSKAGAGDPAAQLELAQIYKNGVPKNEAEAVKWFQLSAEQGNPNAQYGLGMAYKGGVGVTKSEAEALRLLRLSAVQGHAYAQLELGISYYHGLGVPRDYAEAVKFFRLSAEQGCSSALHALGAMYFNGHGVPKDMVLAYKMLNLSASLGNESGAKHRDITEKRMTPTQIEEAQRLSREWFEQKKLR